MVSETFKKFKLYIIVNRKSNFIVGKNGEKSQC